MRELAGRDGVKTAFVGASRSRRIGMQRHAMPLIVAVSLLLGACQPSGQPASKPGESKPATEAKPAAPAAPTAAPAKPADSTAAKPAEAAKPADAKPAAQTGGPVIFLSSQFKP